MPLTGAVETIGVKGCPIPVLTALPPTWLESPRYFLSEDEPAGLWALWLWVLIG